MLDSQEPVGPGPQPGQQGEPIVDPHAVVSRTLDRDPNLSSDIDKALAGADTGETIPPTKSGGVSDLWAKIRGQVSPEKNLKAAARGAAEGINSMSNTIVGAGVGIAKATGISKIGRSPEEYDKFVKWWEQRTADANPLQIPEDKINKWFGPAQGGLPGFVEGAAQFATGLKAVKAIGITSTILAGAAADIGAFDPHAKRLSNLIQDGPAWLRNPLTQMLEAKDDDSEAVSRVKQAAEGILTNATMEALMAGVKALRGKKAKVDPKEIASHIDAGASAKEAEHEVAKVVPAGDGKFTVAPVTKIGNLDVTTGGMDLEHGTSHKNAKLIQDRGAFDPSQGDRHYDYNEFGTNAVYFQKDGANYWTNPANVSNPTMVPYETAIKARLSDDAKVVHLKSEADVDELKRLIGFEGNSRAFRDALFVDGLRAASDYGADAAKDLESVIGPKKQSANALVDKMKELGIDAIDIPENAPAGFADNQVVVIQPGKVKPKADALTVEHTDETHTFTASEAESLAASFNYVAKNERFVAGKVDDESLAAFKERMKAYADGKDKRSVEEIRDAYGVNIRYNQSGPETVNTIKALVDAMPEPSAATRDTGSWADIAKEADGMFQGMPAEDVLQRMAHVFGTTKNLKSHLKASREYLLEVSNHAFKLSRAVEANPTNSVAVGELGKSLDTLLEAHAWLTGTKSETGAALNSLKMPVGEGLQDLMKEGGSGAESAAKGAVDETAEAATTGADVQGKEPEHRAPSGSPKATEGLTKEQIRGLARSVFLNGPDAAANNLALLRGPKVTAKVVQNLDPSRLSKFWDFTQSWRMNAMLSGPKTHLTNITSNYVTALQAPLEYWWAGARSGNSELRHMGSDMYSGLFDFHNILESWKSARKTFVDGDNILVPSNSHTGTTLGPIGSNGWADLIGLPSRMLMSSDEFAKQMNYRANMRAQTLRQIRQAGVTDPKEIAQRLVDSQEFWFSPDGGAGNGMAKAYANYNTFTNDLRPGGYQKDIQDFVNKHPFGKVILPFVRTPMNIFNHAWERTPLLNRFNKDFAEEFSGKLGPEAQALAQSKNDMGKLMWASGAFFTLTGNMTGRGPTNSALRKQWIAAGNQPYSIKTPAGWVSYNRANPVLTAYGLIADAAQVSSDVSEEEFSDLAAVVVASLVSNIGSKTFMQGATEFADAVGSQDPGKMKRFLTSFVGSFVPNAATTLNPDHTFREARTVLENVESRIPGLSPTLEPRRNLLGEPIMRPPGYFNSSVNPFTVAPGSNPDDVAQELVTLGKSFSMPAEKRNGGLIDLTDRETYNDRNGQSPYDRMLELMAKPNNGMPSLRSTLTKMVNSAGYQKAHGEDAYGPGGLKWKLANNIIQSYQDAAWGQVLKEYPTLRRAFSGALEMQAKGLVKGKSGVDEVNAKYEGLFKK